MRPLKPNRIIVDIEVKPHSSYENPRLRISNKTDSVMRVVAELVPTPPPMMPFEDLARFVEKVEDSLASHAYGDVSSTVRTLLNELQAREQGLL